MNDPKPIPCGNWKEKLAATCPDDLPTTERDAFTIHAASCRSCAAVLADDYRTDTLIRSALIGER